MSDPNATILKRKQRLTELLERKRLDGLIIAKPANVFYLTGFRGSAGIAILGRIGAKLWVDPRYTLQAQADAAGVEVIEKKSLLLEAAASWVARKLPNARVGYDEDALSCRDFTRLRQASAGKIRWVHGGGLIEGLREIKDSGEIERVRAAGRLTVKAFEEALPFVRPGVREIELAAEIEYRMKRNGADGPAFETIVASGRRSAWPHARPSSKPLQTAELVIFDLGAILGGYAADMTRTLWLGKPPAKVRALHAAVEAAQRDGVAAARAGSTAGAVDAVVRKTLGKHKLDRFFTHSTGHGVGIEIHERPRLGKREETALASGNTITIEPGIYIEGVGGIRIEDTVLVTDGAPEILTPADKEPWIIR